MHTPITSIVHSMVKLAALNAAAEPHYNDMMLNSHLRGALGRESPVSQFVAPGGMKAMQAMDNAHFPGTLALSRAPNTSNAPVAPSWRSLLPARPGGDNPTFGRVIPTSPDLTVYKLRKALGLESPVSKFINPSSNKALLDYDKARGAVFGGSAAGAGNAALSSWRSLLPK